MAELNTLKEIMLAEDDVDDVMLFTEAIKQIDSSLLLRHAENGNMVFVLLNEKLPDILFLDIYMPYKDGVSCLMEIRKNRAYDSLPIIMYTGIERDITIEDCYANGANLYVTKTAHFTELVDKLKRILSLDWKKGLLYPARDHFVI